jgi:hypothetical protein
VFNSIRSVDLLDPITYLLQQKVKCLVPKPRPIIIFLNLKNMKNFENLGRSLGKEEQKNIIGGMATGDIWCRTSPTAHWEILGNFGTTEGCLTTGMATYCTDPPYHSCRCFNDDLIVWCGS